MRNNHQKVISEEMYISKPVDFPRHLNAIMMIELTPVPASIALARSVQPVRAEPNQSAALVLKHPFGAYRGYDLIEEQEAEGTESVL